MKSSKRNGQIIIQLIALAVYNMIVFIIPFDRTDIFWIAYSFGMLALIIQAFVTTLYFEKFKTVNSRIFALPVLRILFIYLIVQMVISFGFMITGDKVSLRFPVVLCVLNLAFSLVGTMLTEGIRETIVEVEEKSAGRISKMDTMKSRMISMQNKAEYDITVKEAVKKLAEERKDSDPVSNSKSVPIEEKIEDSIDNIGSLLDAKDKDAVIEKCDETIILIKERNSVCKSNKGL